MKLYSTLTSYIAEDDGFRLICSKLDGRLSVSSSSDVIPMDAEEVCDIISVLGRIDIDGANYLLCVTESTVVAEFSGREAKHPIHRIDRVRAISLDSSETLEALGSATANSTESSARRLKQGTGKLIKFVQDKITLSNVQKPSAMLDEILRLFNDHPDFYFCFGRDITHCAHTHYSSRNADPDERFFWNKLLLKDLLDKTIDRELAKKWIVPVMQGSVRFNSLEIADDPEANVSLDITLISRRSVHRAGVRYLRRGIDNESNVANFVETELLLNIFGHHLSFVQVRGSVPVFWSQKGFKYRPPLSIERPVEESMPYFTTHIQELIDRYGSPLVAVNLVDQAGRELKLATSYLEHAAKFNSPHLHYVSFDLHRHCRGLKFDKVNDLITGMEDLLRKIGYCWVDKTGEIVKSQSGVVRVNCVDCLDRTNVVQGAISQWVCMQQAQRLGLFGPLCEPPEALVTLLQNIWADNGDEISTQYAGTAALKGDVTRSGERRLTGIMKDGYNSASRYYLSHVRDSSRQKAMNVLLGNKDQGSESMVDSDSDSEEDENVSRLVAETVHFLLPEGEVVVGGWALCDSLQKGDAIDTILLLTRTKLYVAVYDDELEKLADVRIVPLDDITSLEVGRPSRSARLFLRVTCLEESWTWRAGKTRLFNNVAIRLKTLEEAGEYTESIAEQISVTINLCVGRDVPVQRVERLTLPGSTNTAKRALASMTAALKTRMRRPVAPSGTNTTISNDTVAAESLAVPTTVVDSSLIDISENCGPLDSVSEFRDDMNPNTTTIAPSKIHTSPSDGCLLTEANRPATSAAGLVGRIRGLKTPFTRSNEGSGASANPFKNLLPLMSTSQTNFVML